MTEPFSKVSSGVSNQSLTAEPVVAVDPLSKVAVMNEFAGPACALSPNSAGTP